MAISPEYQTYLIDLFALFGPVVAKRMFGAIGLYADDVMFGIVAGEVIYLKTAERDREAYESEGCKPFSFRMKSRRNPVILTSYYALPDRLYDEPEELALWARRAYEAAASPHSEKKRRKRMKVRSARQPSRRRTRS